MTAMEVDEGTARRIQRWAWIIAGQSRSRCGIFDREDLASVAVVHALKVLPKWDPQRGKLSTYLQLCMRGAIQSYVRDYLKSRCKREGYRDSQTERLCSRESDRMITRPSEHLVEAYEARESLQRWREDNLLTHREYLILLLQYGQGMNAVQISRVIGLTQSRIWQIEENLRQRFHLARLSRKGSYHIRR